MSYPPQDPMDMDAKKDELLQPQPLPSAGGLPQIPESLAVSHISSVPALIHSSSNNFPALHDTLSESGRTSTSALARGSETKWTNWQELNKCRLSFVIRNVQEVEDFSNRPKYPRLAKDEKVVNWLTFLEDNKIKRFNLRVAGFVRYRFWINTLEEEDLEMDDPFQYEAWYNTLFGQWDSHSRANARSANEYARRKGVDSMIELAFELRAGAKHTYRPQEELSLPKSPWTAKASAVTVIDLPLDWANFLQSLPNSHVFTLFQIVFSVPTFILEAKQTDTKSSSRRLTLDFCSVQHQRRALGFKDGPVFGATLVGSNLTLYISMWREDTIVANAFANSFDLNTFPTFVMCYFYLCELSEHISQQVEKEFERWKTESGRKELEQKNREASARPWRSAYRPISQSQASNERRRDDEGNAQDDWDMAESDEREELDENDPEIATMVSSLENGDLAPIDGYPLIVKRLVAHDIYCKKHPNAMDASVVKDIREWMHHVRLATRGRT